MTKSLLIVIAIAPSLLEIQQRHFVVAIIIPSVTTFSSLIVTIDVADMSLFATTNMLLLIVV